MRDAGFRLTDFEELSYPQPLIEKFAIPPDVAKISPYIIIGGEK